MAEQPGSALHSIELKLEQAATVPEHAAQLHPPSVHETLVALTEQGSAVPVHEPAQWQPETLLHVAALTRVVHAGGWPVQAASQAQPESTHVVSESKLPHAVAVPLHLFAAQLQPSTLVHAAEVVTLEHFVGVPEQELVGPQPLAAWHC